MAKKPTIFQRINSMFSGNGAIVNNYNVQRANPDDIIVKTKDKDEYDTAALQARQQHLLARQWKRAQYDITNRSLASLNEIKLMYREADLMDLFPEIGTALDVVTEECNYIGDSGCVINITSGSERVKAILQDLFVNRLSINVMLPMICRCMCKYGNDFLLLNIDDKNGVTGWKELPVYEIERYENGMENPYASAYTQLSNVNPYMQNSTKFVWVGTNEYIPYQDWQIAHFRLLYNSIFLPYGCSFLQKARRHFRLLSMMEDSMLLYRLERSVERRVFKINVGAIDEQDVPAYVQQIANEFKRTPIIDPMTGQIDLRKNVLPVWKKTPIPLLDGRTITIEELAKEYENGKINYVYSIQDNSLQIVPGKVVWCGKNYTPTTMVKITLDDNSYMVMAPEHEIIMRDGTRKRADKVCEGESVMPFKTNDTIIKAVEYIDGDDVYCMTVVGLNGEEDRHNFALRTFISNDEWNDSGCFVSNCNLEDFFIPVRSDDAPNPIETLPAAQNLNAIDDIKFIQNKVFTALRVPKSFLNFEEAQGDGKNLSLLDVRFSKTVNRIQQALIMELNKVAIVHLILLGLTDELTNFTITMNNPSSQAEMLEIENLAKKITTAKDAITDGGNGIPLMSVTRAWKTILKWSDKEIADNLEELRLENALAGELKKTFQIIKRTGIFDPVDNVYGEAGAEYSDTPEEGADDGGVMGGGGSSAGAAIGGGDVDFGEEDMGGEEMDNGQEGEMDIENAANEDNGGIEGGQPEQANENLGSRYMKKLLTETLRKQKKISLDLQKREKHYAELLKKKINEERIEKEKKDNIERIPLLNKNFLINEELDSLQKQLNEFTKKKD